MSTPYSHRISKGFTLVELLVVLSLIVLALAAAVPAFSYITGSRSTDSAENIIAATLQRARAQAIQSGIPTGVLFFVNPTDQRATMALISEAAGEDRYANYRGWTDTSYQQLGSTVSRAATVYQPTQEVVALTMTDIDPTSKYNLTNLADKYHNVTSTYTHDSTATQGAPPTPTSTPWLTSDATFELLADTGFETLPANLAVQTINDPKGVVRDRYIQTGVILFDATGRCVSIPYKFKKGSSAYNLIAKDPGNTSLAIAPLYLPASITATATASDFLWSQLGLVIYDRAAFLAQPGASEGDPVFQSGGVAGGTNYLNLTGPASAGLESQEESWLDKNTTPLFVNRGNGTLLKGQ